MTQPWRFLASRCAAVVGLLALACAGCTSLSAGRDEPFSYEQMRREVEGPRDPEIRRSWEEKGKRTDTRLVKTKKDSTLADYLHRATGKNAKPEEAKALYAEAENLYRQALAAEGESRRGAFRAASKKYLEAAKAWPDSSLEQDAYFMAGEASFFADDYPEANKQFELLLKKHPNSRYLDLVEARRFAMAQYWLASSEYHGDSLFTVNLFDKTRPWHDARGHALRVFDRIRIDDPTGKLADDATMAAGNAHFRRGRYVRADEFYADLRKTFPSSEHQFLAHFLGAKAKLNSYEGADYSGVPLDEAEELLKQIRRQFPAEYEKHREELERMYAEVRFRQAERDWATAQYYEKQKAYGAARFYYDIVARDFPETSFAQAARQRIGEIAELPPRPEQKFEWLVKQFPSSREQRPLVATGAPPSMKR